MKKYLNGQWKIRCIKDGENCSSKEEFDARVPGDITMDCFRNREIENPYYGMNYKEERFVLERDYEYRLNFYASAPKSGEQVFLVFKGIDTFSEISLNGKFLARTDNMFLGYEFDVTDELCEQNTLCVKMFSTLKHMKKIDAEKYFACFNKERIFLRKEQCCFGWDWAPDLPGYGIWDDVYLDYRSQYRISEVKYHTYCDGAVSLFATLNYSIREEEFSLFAKTDKLRYSIEPFPGAGFSEAITGETSVKGAKNFYSLTIKDPKLWMPIGYGEPNLYSYKIELLRDGKILDCYAGKLGIREVELIERPVECDRMSFKLRINATDIFVKGSNWVPCECFTGEVLNEKYEKLIALAADGGFNMLRVWGGGIYEKEIFYRLCDESGIMVWQDFMFACADIPEMDTEFVENTTKEAIYQVKRLRNHPSLVYWCGGNEKTGSCGLLKQYGDNLVDVTLRGIVNHYDGTRPYVRQSPYSLTDVGNDSESGESHGSAFDVVSINSYDEFLRAAFNRKVSFASECAIMGSCVPEEYKKFVPEEEFWPLGSIYEDRFCDNPYGNGNLTFVQKQLKTVKLLFGEARGIEEFAVKSMAAQAEILKIEALNIRKQRNICGGFMNWMFDDIWQTGTWSLIDYDLNPKIAYYALKREFAPFRAAVLPDGEGNYFGYLINDTSAPVCATVKIGGGTLDELYEAGQTGEFIAAPCSVTELGKIDVKGDLIWMECESSLGHQTATTFKKGFDELSFTRDYSVQTEQSEDKNAANVVITANKYARLVHIEVPEGCIAEDNWFDVLPGKSMKVHLRNVKTEEIGKIIVKDYSAYLR